MEIKEIKKFFEDAGIFEGVVDAVDERVVARLFSDDDSLNAAMDAAKDVIVRSHEIGHDKIEECHKLYRQNIEISMFFLSLRFRCGFSDECFRRFVFSSHEDRLVMIRSVRDGVK